MSGTLTAYSFTAQDAADIRRYCGYPPYGTGVVTFADVFWWPQFLALETRLVNLTAAEAAPIVTHVAQLRTLEAAIPTVSDNLDTDQAAVWYHNKNELRDRMALYRTWRSELCAMMGIPAGPSLKSSGGTRLIV